jgi:hypothetical protein
MRHGREPSRRNLSAASFAIAGKGTGIENDRTESELQWVDRFPQTSRVFLFFTYLRKSVDEASAPGILDFGMIDRSRLITQ